MQIQLSNDPERDLRAYLTGHWLTDLATFSAFVFHSLPRLNWAGFYLFDGNVLRLGPFVGKPACTEIRMGKGVCGTAFSRRETLVVADVDAFPGHIVCDSASRSEIVIPLAVGEICFGVFDVDSPELARFGDEERKLLERWVEVLLEGVKPEVWTAKPWKSS